MKCLQYASRVALITFIGLSSSSIACDLHGNSQYGQFAGFHPLAMQHYNQARFQLLTLTHPKTTQSVSGSESVVNISYRIPLEYRNVKMSFSGTEYIEFVDASILSLQQEQGVYELKYKVTKPGNHQISIHIDAMNNNEPFNMKQKISVLSS